MPAPSFDLIDVIKTIQKQKRIVILMTLAAMVIGAGFYLVKKKKYKATSVFLVNNPLYGDRNTLFRNKEQRYVDYFGGDDDLDRITAFLNSDTVRDRVIRNCQFQTVYGQDINTGTGHAQLMSIFNKNFNVKRSEYREVEVSYIAYDSVTAANVANMSVKVLEETVRSYYTGMKNNMYTSINDKLHQLDSAVNIYTDSLATLRDKYGIYNIISPSRENVMSGDIKGNGKGFGMGVEQIQNVESIKDQLVMDRAHYMSILNEFSATTNSAMEFVKVITRAVPPNSPSGPSLVMIVVVAAALGLIFSLGIVLFLAYYRLLNAVQR